MKWTNTNDAFSSVGGIIVRGLKQELIDQKHNASGRLSRGLKKSKMFNIKNGKGVNVISTVAYWKAVNNPKFAKKPKLNAIASWVQKKGLPLSAIAPIFRKLNNRGYGKPYVYWTEGNSLRRTDFAGHTARKHKDEVVKVIGEGAVKDVVNMVKATIKENIGTKNVRFTK
tara:strand:- start:51 stop:560 length:510 start_codon:yes stop_codon:yes gene_type:complete